MGVRVHQKVDKGDGPENGTEALALRDRVRNTGTGRYILRVPFPHLHHHYRLAWKPVPDERVVDDATHYGRFDPLARAHGNDLLTAFAGAFASTPLWGRLTLCLYSRVPGPNPSLKLVATSAPGDPATAERRKSYEFAAPSIEVGDRSAVGRAWCGEVVRMEQKPADPDEARAAGFVRPVRASRAVGAGGGTEKTEGTEEVALFCVPLRFEMDWINLPPWGVVRVGVWKGRGDSGEGLSPADMVGKMWRLLNVAATALLAVVHERGER